MFRLAAPYFATFAVDTALRVDNTKSKRELGWTPGFPTYRDGLAAIATTTPDPCTLRSIGSRDPGRRATAGGHGRASRQGGGGKNRAEDG